MSGAATTSGRPRPLRRRRSTSTPAASSASIRPTETKSVDEYVSDPNHPVPFVGYTTDTVPQRYMVDDQRFASYRPDVLVYETDPLTEDVTIAGPISPHLEGRQLRHRFRFRREAHRRLSGGLSRSRMLR